MVFAPICAITVHRLLMCTKQEPKKTHSFWPNWSGGRKIDVVDNHLVVDGQVVCPIETQDTMNIRLTPTFAVINGQKIMYPPKQTQ